MMDDAGRTTARLLVIDDDTAFRSVLVDILEAEGYQVDSAGGGAQGVALAQQAPPDLILCDIMMSGLDGYGVLNALRQDPLSAVIPVIFLTGVAGTAAVRRGMDLGADDYLVKPVSRDEVVQAVEARLARHAALRREVQRRVDGLRIQLAQSLPHEFLTPLTAVMALSSLLMEEDVVVELEAVREVARGILLSGQRLQEIIAKFLFYAELADEQRRPAQGARDEDMKARHAGRLIEEVARAKAARMGRGGDLEVHVEDASLPILRDHLRPIVEELVENGLRFSPPGSPVRVTCTRDGDGALLSVSDVGRGMTAEQVAGLRHYGPSVRRHAEQPGFGLGLAIVHRLADINGGRVGVDTAPGRGTSVRVWLPWVMADEV